MKRSTHALPAPLLTALLLALCLVAAPAAAAAGHPGGRTPVAK
jgi:hypothetical protein